MFALDDKKTVTAVGTKDPGRRLFDCIVYMPRGTTYNSYYIRGGTHRALIDCSDPRTSAEMIANLGQAGADRIDYVILLHAEQDHSGNIREVLALHPEARVVCTEKVRQLMAIHLHLGGEKMIIVKEGDRLDLGGMDLTFYSIPFAHWPDNTMAHLMPQNILFSSDLFGAHDTGAETADDLDAVLIASARSYLSEIMMPFRRNVARYAETAAAIAPAVIAPAHGTVYRRPEQILDLYRTWTGDGTAAKAVIPFVSMHDSVRTAVECLAEELERRGIGTVTRDLGDEPASLLIRTGELIDDLVDAAAVVFAFPTVLGGPHPAMVYAAATSNAMMPKTGLIGMMCSYAWATKACDTVTALTQNFKGKRLEPLLFKGLPTDDDLENIRGYAAAIASGILSGRGQA